MSLGYIQRIHKSTKEPALAGDAVHWQNVFVTLRRQQVSREKNTLMQAEFNSGGNKLLIESCA